MPGDAGATASPVARSPSKTIALDLHAGADPGAGGDRPRQVGDVGGPLRVQAASLRAGAALDAAPGVTRQGVVAEAERLGALHQELAVAPHPLRVHRA